MLRSSSWGVLGVILARLGGPLEVFGVPFGGLLGFLGGHVSALGGCLGGSWGRVAPSASPEDAHTLPTGPRAATRRLRKTPKRPQEGFFRGFEKASGSVAEVPRSPVLYKV